jgi:hypothetical protein
MIETEVPPIAAMPNRRCRRFVPGHDGTQYRLDIARAGQLIVTR